MFVCGNDNSRMVVGEVFAVSQIKHTQVQFSCSIYDHIVHLYSRCHTSYVTKYEPHQQEECEDQFRKVCLIDYEKKSIEELVKYCVTPMVKDCNKVGEQVCKTVFQSECFTRQKVHEVQILQKHL